MVFILQGFKYMRLIFVLSLFSPNTAATEPEGESRDFKNVKKKKNIEEKITSSINECVAGAYLNLHSSDGDVFGGISNLAYSVSYQN